MEIAFCNMPQNREGTASEKKSEQMGLKAVNLTVLSGIEIC